MRLPHHPDVVAQLRTPTPEDPWRVLVSGCIASFRCAVDGSDYGLGTSRPDWLVDPRVRCFPHCPEHHGMGTPRTMPDLHGGDGFAVLDGTARVLDEHGTDHTAAILEGSQAMLALAKRRDVDFAVLTDRSGSCGSQVISLGCRFDEPVVYARGVGVTTATLLRAGVNVVSHRDFKTLRALRSKLWPSQDDDSDAPDHHNHPWVLEHLPPS